MILDRFTKQPVEVKDYDVGYAPWLDVSADSLEEVTTAVTLLSGPDTTPLRVERTEMTVDRIKLWVAGGADGAKYKLEITVTTVGGRTDQSELIFTVKEI